MALLSTTTPEATEISDIFLKLKEPFKSNNFEITMRCLNSKVAMAFENQKEKNYGFQFHPESFLTINGNLLIKKILSA